MCRLLVLLIFVLATPSAASAATPASGSVAPEAPVVEWTGSVAGDSFAAAHLFLVGKAGGTQGQCRAPVCDTFTLTVAAGGTRLTVKVAGETEDDYTAVEVRAPDGSTTYVYEAGPTATVALAAPKAGDYAVRTLGSPAPPNATMDYRGTAILEAPAPPAPAPSAGGDAPPPADSAPPPEGAPPSGEPQPLVVEGEKPPPPPRTLAAEPDRRRLVRAVQKGFRVRTVCTGGCAKLKVRLYISPLLGRQLGLGSGKEEVEVGSAPIVRGAEGRRAVQARVKPTARRRLVRLRRFTLAVETVAFDPGGGVRSFTRRITLRR